MTAPPPNNSASWPELLRAFLCIGINSFGGPAGQIGVMHKVLVDDKRWLDDRRFTQALNVCMLLPGPEATQLVTYTGWLLKGVRGGLAAGLLFILPGALCMLALSMIVVAGGKTGLVAWLLIGVQAAAVALVFEAVVRIARRVLKTGATRLLAIGALVASIVHVPFPFIVLGAMVIGWCVRGDALAATPPSTSEPAGKPAKMPRLAGTLGVLFAGLAIWFGPLALVLAVYGQAHVLSELAILHTKAALVSFGGAYAAISYVASEAMRTYQWIDGSTMATGLSLAETTPGPLVLVFQFIGYAAGHAQAPVRGEPAILHGLLGSAIALWATFVPCFLWIFLIAPYMEVLRARARLNVMLATVSAAVVGVVANFGIVLAIAALFGAHAEHTLGWARFNVPVWNTVRWTAVIVALLALFALVRLKWGVGRVVLQSALIGALIHAAESASLADQNSAE
jgi:chromate transporter